MCEHTIDKSIMQHLKDHGLLTNSQYDFRAKHSCERQLLTLVDELLQGVAKGKQYDIAIMDFNKAFDVASHKCLLEKLQYYDIKGACLDWIKDFPKNRSQRVVVDGE